MLLALLLACGGAPEAPPPPDLAPVTVAEAPVRPDVAALEAAAARALDREAGDGDDPLAQAEAGARLTALLGEIQQVAREGGSVDAQLRLERELMEATAAYERLRPDAPELSRVTSGGLPLLTACGDATDRSCRDLSRLNALASGHYGVGVEALARMLAERDGRETGDRAQEGWAERWLVRLHLQRADVDDATWERLGTLDPSLRAR